jgi:IS605 OrfB family transposase
VEKKTGKTRKDFTKLRTAHFRVMRIEEQEILRQAVGSTLHFQNMLIMLVDENYQSFQDGTQENLRDRLLNKRIMRALFAETDGGRLRAEVRKLRDQYREHILFQHMLVHAKTLKEKNLAQTVGKLRAAYKSFFTKLKKGDKTARPPKERKLRKMTNYSMPIDQEAWSFAKEDRIRINLHKKMQDFHLNHKMLLTLVRDLKSIQSVEVSLQHSELYFSISYFPPEFCKPGLREVKSGGMDLGVNNIASVFVEDQRTPSLVVSGENLKIFNQSNNYRLDKAKSERKLAENALLKKKDELQKQEGKSYLSQLELEQLSAEYSDITTIYQEAKNKVCKYYSERHNFFKDVMHKLSCRILEYVTSANVTHLFVSSQLGEAKQDQGLKKQFNKNFHPVPIVKLVEYLKLKGGDYGVTIEDIDESYTSRCSCLSGKVVEAQRIAAKSQDIKERREKLKLADVFNGRRVSAEYRDSSENAIFHADVNGAANHVIVGTRAGPMQWLKNFLWKLSSPIVVDINSLFLDFRSANYEKLRGSRASFAAEFLGQICNVQVCSR